MSDPRAPLSGSWTSAGLLGLLLTGLAGCQSLFPGPTPYAHCLLDHRQGWQVLSRPPANAAELLRLPARGGGTVESALHLDGARREVWFAQADTEVAICRYRPTRDICTDQATSVRFTWKEDEWTAGFVGGTLCHVLLPSR